MALRNVCIVPHQYTTSQPDYQREHSPAKNWYPTTSLHRVNPEYQDLNLYRGENTEVSHTQLHYFSTYHFMKMAAKKG